MDIKQLRFLIALARERHFGRAADTCFVSQPTLSARIRQLEQELDVLLVERAQHSYHGLTSEGERVLRWAQSIVTDCDAMRQDVSAMQKELKGDLKLGVVPSALPFSPTLTAAFHARHPKVSIKVLSQSSVDIQRNLDNFDIDAALTYVDNEPLQRVNTLPLYSEHYCLLSGLNDRLADQKTISWSAAGREPLCLLTTDMQNRRIIDDTFHRAGVDVTPRIETNSIVNLFAHVRLGGLATILPRGFVEVMGIAANRDDCIMAIPLNDPDVSFTIGLVASNHDPASPMARAMFEVGEQTEMQVQPVTKIR